ncbi:hypothetical protein DFJ58DRAFT_716274 [Suillus subalutaceus]|uniref:uncharacterized protein n=1 Tax=Suillus subalutaceus TaxID=48586 RepID=UPI001B862702|nr:uncharacterized protein DFJ58DRAFT_716274 [Suillus subalutaceus]KAG1854936.1 hypothetical protein DFJ58DRAFT_716274 [Suillus subalutaceus]
MSSEDREAVETMLIDHDVDTESLPYTAPPGEEGVDLSHEGGEYEAFEGLAQQMANISGCLIYHGYLGCSPLHPTVAISLRTLAVYQQTHRTCLRYSIQAQCKSLCHLHDIPYRPYFNTQFSDAYDVYLEILHRVDSLIKAALKHNTPNWRLLNSCPCCFYKLEGEHPLAFEWLATIDGNNSLKRWLSSIYGTSPHNDSRTYRSDYWLSRAQADEFQKGAQTQSKERNDDWEDVIQSESAPASFHCVDRWRNAGPEQRKRMFSIFDESGIIVAACRHRIILLACDMVKSGELAKYPLAIIDRLLDIYGKNRGVAYDIGCAFSKTLDNSSLGPRARALNFRMMVGAFHGHAHNRRCQIDWHPLYIEGTGHTEGEGCEHIFSSSNELARSTRHASPFHRHQAIEQHFSFWDEDKYAALTLTAVQTLSAELATLQNFLRFHEQEPYSKLQNAEAMASHLEIQLGIEKQWEIGSEHYNRFRQEASLLNYQTALDELERLVVMRLFELSKLSLSGTGYKLRQQISKALQCRSEAIRNALGQYNTQATALVPPRPQLTWKDIVEYSFLGKFDLLRQSRSDIRSLDWTKPAHREATVKYFKIQCTREEIQRLNVEIRRLRTAIYDEELTVNATIEVLLTSNRPVGLELQLHLFRLDQIASQSNFSGTRGIDIPAVIHASNNQAESETAASNILASEQSDGDILEHEEEARTVEDFADFLASVAD